MTPSADELKMRKPHSNVSVRRTHLECRPERAEDLGMVETERAAEMRKMLEEYAESGVSRREFCEQRGIRLTTLDYWRRELQDKTSQRQTPKGSRAEAGQRARMVKVEVAGSEAREQFTLRLANGRRIESSWRFAEAELARLIRIVESA